MIFQKQYEKLLAQAIYNYLLEGRLPNIEEVSKSISNLTKDKSNALFSYITQPSRALFQNESFNKSLKQLNFDINLVQESILELINKNNTRVSYSDLFHKIHISELKRLESELNLLLFTIQNADFYFLGAYDNFNDLSKTDKNNSDDRIVDLTESCLVLPYGGKNTKKINTSHLYNEGSWPIDVISSGQIISSSIIAGTKFGNIFNDLNEVWLYEVVTNSQSPTSISFTFPLAGSSKEEIEVFVNRFQIISHGLNDQKLLVQVSNDNINFITPLGYEDGILLVDQKTTYGMDFETNLVQYVKLTLTKNTYDIEQKESSTYKFVFGLKNFSAFTIGRKSSGRYQSIPFDFSGNEEKISKVSIEATSQVFNGTSINYSIALANDNDIITPFINISPINQSSKSIGIDNIVSFNTTTDHTRSMTVNSSGTNTSTQYGSTFQGKIFYAIGDDIVPAPLFKSCTLFRGFDGWSRDISNGFKTIDIDNNYITFQNSDDESLYVISKEIVSSENQLSTGLVRKVQLTTIHPVYYIQSKGHLLKPADISVDPFSDNKPNYSVYKILLNSSVTRNSKSFTLSSQLTQLLPVSNFVTQSSTDSELPQLSLSTGQILRPNIDYIVETEIVSGRPRSTGVFTIPSTSSLLNSSGVIHTPNLLLVFTYTNDPDITYKISNISDNFITLDNLQVSLDDSIEVSYRYVPVAPNEIIKASIRVANSTSNSSSRTFYIEGVDYIINAITGAIQRLPSGNIPAQGSVYVEYTYRSADEGIQTFSTWCNITTSTGIQLKFDLNETTKKNKLIADLESGEGFFVNTAQGLIDLTNAVNSPVLGPGWIQFVVRSKNPTTNSGFRTNLIDQVIQLRDAFKKKIFRSNNFYFNQITAFRDSMDQVTLNHLKVNTLKTDHSVFAIDNTTDPRKNYLVLNFLPNSTNELYNFGPTDDSDSSSPPQEISEQFLLTWSSKSEDQLIGNKIIVRIDLERSDQADGSITPKVFDYKIRASI